MRNESYMVQKQIIESDNCYISNLLYHVLRSILCWPIVSNISNPMVFPFQYGSRVVNSPN